MGALACATPRPSRGTLRLQPSPTGLPRILRPRSPALKRRAILIARLRHARATGHQPPEAAEKSVAHGVSRGPAANFTSSPAGAKESSAAEPALSGAKGAAQDSPAPQCRDEDGR